MKYRIGSYNVRKGRPARRVAFEVRRLMRRHRLHAVALQECATQLRELDEHLPNHLRVIGYPGRGVSARDSAHVVNTRALCRKGVTTRRSGLLSLGGVRWERAPRNRWKGLHNERAGVVAGLGPLHRLLSMHLPPGPHSWPLRGAAHAAALDALTRRCNRWNRYSRNWVVIGDANMTPRDERARELEHETEGTIHGWGIDWLLAGPGVIVHKVYKVRRRWLRSDHPAFVAVVEV